MLSRHGPVALMMWNLDLEPAYPVLRRCYAPSPHSVHPKDPIVLLHLMLVAVAAGFIGSPNQRALTGSVGRDLGAERLGKWQWGEPMDPGPGEAERKRAAVAAKRAALEQRPEPDSLRSQVRAGVRDRTLSP